MVQELEVSFYLVFRCVAHDLQPSQGDWLLSNPVTSSCVQRRDLLKALYFSVFYLYLTHLKGKG